ncbi:translocation/assembly module TamB domain-containing protein [Marinobacter sp. chi1]|uniref:Translocation/assembly module TamB domain-containing protein n=1 Tax=Marinobacter suaedae TaxID=3057675 RepID=A0ABT8VW87_9GAMM|nr:translocation/assembly module TamB domain-containing protein [Marinobacter sp. chi1]MDO3720253.1 translocation/assembly module TamB domain-containing protein [Marinobacter sp. chi1]
MSKQPDQQNESPSGRRSVWFWLLWILLILLLLPVLLVGAVLLALRSDAGTAWVLEQVPGLEVTDGRGSVLGLWQAERLVWQGYGVQVDLAAPRLDWSPSCLVRKQVCLDTLVAEQIDVQVEPPEEKPESEPRDIVLPEVDLPFGVRVGDVRLGPFLLNDATVWNQLTLSAEGAGADWQVNELFYEWGDYSVSLSGRLETRRDWPIDLSVLAELPPPAGDRWRIAVDLGGSVRDLRLAGNSEGYLEAELDGEVEPLDPDLPVRLRIDSRSFLAHGSLPETLTLKDWFVEADGSLTAGFDTRGEATLPGTRGPILLSLKGDVTTSEASGISLVLQSGEAEEPGVVAVDGRVGWQGGLDAEADLSLRSFPWYSLLPDMAEPPVEVQKLDGTVSWNDGRYQAALSADIAGPQGDASVSSKVDGDTETIRLTDLNVSTEAGSLNGQATVRTRDVLAWEGSLALDKFNPGYWVPALSASLSGQLTTDGRLREGQIPDLRANWDLSGQWQDQPARVKGGIDTASGSWEVSGLALDVGVNRVRGSGTWGETLEGALQVQLPEPRQLLEGLAGELVADIRLSGTPEQPEGNVTLEADGLAWRDTFAIEQLAIEAGIQAGFRLDGQVRASGIDAAGQTINALGLDIDGDRTRHTLAVTASHPQADVDLTFAGGFAGDSWKAWNGRFSEGVVALPKQKQRWTLEAPASLAYSETGRLTFGAHCWAWQKSQLCAGDQVLAPAPELDYRLVDFPTTALASLLPENIRWEALLNANLKLTMTDAGPSGRVEVDAGTADVSLLVDDEWEAFRYDQLLVALNLRPEMAEVELALAGPRIGELSLDAAVDPRASERSIEGEFSLEKLDVELAGVLAGLQEVKGVIEGGGRISGPLMRPAVNGELRLADGRLVDSRLPLLMELIEVTVELNGYSASLDGRVDTGGGGFLGLEGDLDWRDDPEVDITLRGERVAVNLEPYAQLDLAPDLNIDFRQGRLKVAGVLAVPRGAIEIQGLPPQAVSVSKDEVIVGVEKEKPLVRDLEMDVRVVVGEDEVSFVAFGVEGNLEGTLRIGNNMDTRGTLSLVDGRYEAFGQELELRTARVLFVGAIAQPYLDIEAIRTVDAVVAGIRLTGPAQSPSTEVFSVPEMPEGVALSYLILGRAPETRGEEGQMSTAALSLGLNQTAELTGKIGEELGIEQFALEAEGAGDETSVVASGYLTDELSIRYGVGIFEPITTVALRYDLGKYFYVEAASGLAASLDIFYTRDF